MPYPLYVEETTGDVTVAEPDDDEPDRAAEISDWTAVLICSTTRSSDSLIAAVEVVAPECVGGGNIGTDSISELLLMTEDNKSTKHCCPEKKPKFGTGVHYPAPTTSCYGCAFTLALYNMTTHTHAATVHDATMVPPMMVPPVIHTVYPYIVR